MSQVVYHCVVLWPPTDWMRRQIAYVGTEETCRMMMDALRRNPDKKANLLKETFGWNVQVRRYDETVRLDFDSPGLAASISSLSDEEVDRAFQATEAAACRLMLRAESLREELARRTARKLAT